MTDDGSDPEHSLANDPVVPALAAWARDARLTPHLEGGGAAFCVLDAEGGRLIRASETAEAWASTLFGPDGLALPRLALPDQIRRSALPEDGSRLVRLRLDPRRIAPPSACLLARGRLGTGEAALLLVPTGPVPAARRPATAPEAPALTLSPSEAENPPATAGDPPEAEIRAPAPEIAAEPPPAPRPGDRFLWRSDASDVVTEISGGPRAALAPHLVGRSWATHAQAGRLRAAEALLAALAGRETFRGVPAEIVLDGAPEPVGVELSGAPVARNGHPFAGYGGFGLIRAPGLRADLPAAPDLPAEAPSENPPVPSAAVAEAAPLAASFVPAAATLAALSLAALVPVARFGRVWTGRDRAALSGPAACLSGPERAAPEPVAPPPAPDERSLSVSEHAAFREIARALGARFAGDEAPTEPARPHEGGAVMPFPASRLAESRQAEADLADSSLGEARALLDGLPAAILIRRDDSLLHANTAFLALAGFPDVAAFAISGGLARLILRSGEADAPAGGTTGGDRLITREDGVRAIEVARGQLPWQGVPAEALVVRVRDAEASAPASPVPARRGEAVAFDLDAFEDGILTLDGEDRVLGLNRSAAGMFGRDAAFAIGQPILALFAPESAMHLRAALHAPGAPAREVAIRGRAPVSFRLARPLADGRRIAILRDLADVKRLLAAAERARAEVEAMEAWKESFLAKVSHEIRTPMNGILGFADVMLNGQFGPVPERYRDYLRDIHASGEHVLGLVNDLVDLARIESGSLDLAFGPVPLNELVSSCVSLLQPQAARDRIVLRTSFSSDLTTLVADERSMRQAALNVIANAIRFTEAGGQVIVSTTVAERGEIALRVRDTGVGMSPDEIACALEPFRTAAIAGPRRGGGTGLGLPLTKALVEANHGHFRITSRKDEGTLVEMLFPSREAMSA